VRHAREDYNRIQDSAGLIPDDEPLFLIRGQDMAGPETLRQYAIAASRLGASDELVLAALRQAQAMREWQHLRRRKTPDLPSGETP
jgi:hypothetical protein